MEDLRGKNRKFVWYLDNYNCLGIKRRRNISWEIRMKTKTNRLVRKDKRNQKITTQNGKKETVLISNPQVNKKTIRLQIKRNKCLREGR